MTKSQGLPRAMNCEEGREEMIRNALSELPVSEVAKLLRVLEKLVEQVALEKGDACLMSLYSRGLMFEKEAERRRLRDSESVKADRESDKKGNPKSS